MLHFSLVLINRFHKTESANFLLCRFSLFLKDPFLQYYLVRKVNVIESAVTEQTEKIFIEIGMCLSVFAMYNPEKTACKGQDHSIEVCPLSIKRSECIRSCNFVNDNKGMASSCQPTNEEIDKEDKEDFKLTDVVVNLEDSKLIEQEEIKHQIF